MLLLVAFIFFLGSPVLAPAYAAGQVLTPETFTRVAETASPAVVNIRTVKSIRGGGPVFRHFWQSPDEPDSPFKHPFEEFFKDHRQKEHKQRSLGSGFIIDKDGFIVTNNHVIEDAEEIEVKLKNGQEYKAEIIGRDSITVIALIKIKPPKGLSVLNLGQSDRLRIGEWVVAIGNPFGLENTVTAGIVSAKGRVIGSGPYDDFIQTDASINPGNSGGPLLNLNGEVIGINTAIIRSGQGIGFAVPISLARSIIEQLKNDGEVTRGWLGVAIQNLSEELAEYYKIKNKEGVLVMEVFEGDPADTAGIKPKDIILKVNGKKTNTTHDLTRLIADLGVNDTATIEVFRGGRTKTFKVKIAKRDEDKLVSKSPESPAKDELGLKVADLSEEIANRLNLTEDEGVIVIEVASGSQGDKAGIEVGDIIKEINHKQVEKVESYRRIIKDIKDGEQISMFIRRKNAGFLVIKLIK